MIDSSPTAYTDRPLVYLACPYSFGDAATRGARFEAVTKTAAELMKQGHNVFSPITHGHPVNLMGVAGGWHRWAPVDEAILSTCCREMIVLTLEGWQESIGIQAEIALADKLGIPITYMDLI